MIYGFTLIVSSSSNDLGDADFDISAFENPQSLSGKNGCVLFDISNSLENYIDCHKTKNWLILCKGRAFSGVSLVESISAILDESGDNDKSFVERILSLSGQFCCVCFNYHTGKTILLTDPSGLHSLFIHETESSKYISTNLTCLKKIIPKESLLVDVKNQEYILRYGYSMAGFTVYRNIYEMLPKKIIIKDLLGTKAKLKDYQIVSHIEDEGYQYKKLHSRLYEKLLHACKDQLGDCKIAGVLLGGFDSALVVSLLHQLGVKVQTYSFYYEDSSLNQPHVEELAAKLDLEHTWVQITPDIIKSGLDDYELYANNPSLWLNYICQTQHLCKVMAKDNVDVIFSGDGCDSLFLGYPNTHRRGGVYKKLPLISRRVSSTLQSMVGAVKIEYIFGHIARVLLSMLEASTYKVESRPLRAFQIFGPISFKILTNNNMKYVDDHDTYLSCLAKKISDLTYERKIYFSKSLISPNRTKMTSCSDCTGINIYSPYLHPGLVEFASNIPDDELRSERNQAPKEGKHLLMKMADEYNLLPREIIYQEKIAAIKSPIDRWIAINLYDYAIDQVKSLPFSYNKKYVASIFKEKKIEKLYKNNFSNDGVVSLAASLLLTYASFFK